MHNILKALEVDHNLKSSDQVFESKSSLTQLMDCHEEKWDTTHSVLSLASSFQIDILNITLFDS